MTEAALAGRGTSPAQRTGATPALAGGGRGRHLPARVSFVLALVVLAVALAIGSGLGSSGHPTAAQRAAALEADIRCPSCEDLSVAQSAASSAIAVRHEVSQMIAAGESDQQIETALVAQYGPSILLRPPTSGLSALVWFVPAVAGAGALGAVAYLFWRRSRALHRLREGPG